MEFRIYLHTGPLCLCVCTYVCTLSYLSSPPVDWLDKGNPAQSTRPLHAHIGGRAGRRSVPGRTGNCSCSSGWSPAAWWEHSSLGVCCRASPRHRGGPNSRRTNDVCCCHRRLRVSASSEWPRWENGAAAKEVPEAFSAQGLPEGSSGKERMEEGEGVRVVVQGAWSVVCVRCVVYPRDAEEVRAERWPGASPGAWHSPPQPAAAHTASPPSLPSQPPLLPFSVPHTLHPHPPPLAWMGHKGE